MSELFLCIKKLRFYQEKIRSVLNNKKKKRFLVCIFKKIKSAIGHNIKKKKFKKHFLKKDSHS